MAKQTFLAAAAALTLLAACNGPSVPQPTPPPRPDLQTAPADLPPPPLLGGPPEERADGGTLLGGPYATPDKPGPLTTFRRADGVEVTVMRPIPNPGDEPPPAPRPRVHERVAASGGPAPVAAGPVEALAPTEPLPPPQVVEQAKPSAPPHGARHRVRIKPPASPKAVIAPPAVAPAKPSLVDRLSQDKVPTPGGETTPKALLGGLLVLAAMVLLVAIARRIARAREARQRARRAAARQAIAPEPETPAADTPPEPEPKP
jgi:hypothetical protein